ncbi:hypothetical protein [Domibacillus iocasae]|uniref:Uncharacterized protein n=1 Tax=Domibacillus iocasae TaxID=1714016 RepID=A0A1E7DSF3_9BACI|nr:hypothetical protein [Domibacillus iocasae]OES46014.1 hypothetical protein BA724_16750 [Domibacillus iocasae]
MISEVEFAIQWMVSGQNPDAKHGADRTGAYTLDPKLIEAVVPNKVMEEERKITADEKWLLDDGCIRRFNAAGKGCFYVG